MAISAQDLRDAWPNIFGSATTYTDAYLDRWIASAELEVDRALIDDAALADELLLHLAGYKALIQRWRAGTSAGGSGSITGMTSLVGSVQYGSLSTIKEQAELMLAEFQRLARHVLPSIDVSGP